jgi:beta-glucosidase/6-phospho-beta-glucosidase/beta-galactosidase
MTSTRLAGAMLALALTAGCGDDAGTPADAGPPDAAIPAPIPDFPEDFLWGTAIAAYQVEGGLHETDWYQWETLCQGCSGDSADDGPDYWNRFDEDHASAEAMHTNAIRIGIEWARVFPTRESFDTDSPDAEAVARYHEILGSARDRGLNVMVTLHHFSTPIWLSDITDFENRSSWEDPAMVDDFERWAAFAAAEFGAEVDYWITLNEPFVVISLGWVAGYFAPGQTGRMTGGVEAMWNMIDGHARAYDALHTGDIVDADGDGESARVSIATHNRVWVPVDPEDPDHVAATDMMRYLNNFFWVDGIIRGDEDRNFDGDFDDPEDRKGDPSIAGRADFIGLNYYGMSLVVPGGGDGLFPFIGIPITNDLDRRDIDVPITDFGWGIFPSGLRQVLDELVPYGLPIIITENGLADSDDDQRPRFLMEHLHVLGQAMADGIPIEGYYHWSLVDNFEWASGFCPQFGLTHFDPVTKDRTAAAGADVYREIIDARNIPEDLWRMYPSYPPTTNHCPRIGL